MPLQPIQSLELASFSSLDIVVAINRSWQYIRPLWLDRSFLIPCTKDQSLFKAIPVATREDDYGAFDRTLVAHCVAYNVSNRTSIGFPWLNSILVQPR